MLAIVSDSGTLPEESSFYLSIGHPCVDYIDECVSMNVVRIIQSYVNMVNKMVWRKEV